MAENFPGEELDEKLFLLEQNFLRDLRRIAEQHLKLERETMFPNKDNLVSGDILNKKAVNKTLAVRLESSLGEKLAKSRQAADGLEEKLQEMRIAFEDKLKTVDRMKAELNRRENVLVASIQQIEAYIRAVFYLKQDANNMQVPLQSSADEQRSALRNLKLELTLLQSQKVSLSKAIRAFQPAKGRLEKLATDLSEYSNIKDLVEYYLVLEMLQDELLEEKSKRAEEELIADRQKMTKFDRQAPAILVIKESAFLNLRSKLKNLRVEITQLEEQIDAATIGRVKDDAARYEIQKWVKKLYLASTDFIPVDKGADNTLDMLKRIKDFTSDAQEITDRLKAEHTL